MTGKRFRTVFHCQLCCKFTGKSWYKKVLVQTGLEWRNIRHGFASAYRQKLSGLEMGQSANREMQADFYCRNSQVEENAVSSA